MEIDRVKYAELDKRDVTIADSFVAPSNKLGAGNGEAKLYIGHEGGDLRVFYGPNKFINKGF
jgi:hypothetical protein